MGSGYIERTGSKSEFAIGRFSEMGTHHKQEFVEFEGFAQEEAGL
jgi:hypothetical protein